MQILTESQKTILSEIADIELSDDPFFDAKKYRRHIATLESQGIDVVKALKENYDISDDDD